MNFMRDIGQSVGTSSATTRIAQRSQNHQSVLAQYAASGRFRNALAALAMSLTRIALSAHAAQQQALGRLYAVVQAQAAVLSYIDAFWMLGIAAGVMFVLTFALKKNNPRGRRGQVLAH